MWRSYFFIKRIQWNGSKMFSKLNIDTRSWNKKKTFQLSFKAFRLIVSWFRNFKLFIFMKQILLCKTIQLRNVISVNLFCAHSFTMEFQLSFVFTHRSSIVYFMFLANDVGLLHYFCFRMDSSYFQQKYSTVYILMIQKHLGIFT